MTDERLAEIKEFLVYWERYSDEYLDFAHCSVLYLREAIAEIERARDESA